MSNDDVLPALTAVIRKFFGKADLPIDRDTIADDVDGWDSVAHAGLMLTVEREFKIRLPSSRLFELDNVGELADLISECRKK